MMLKYHYCVSLHPSLNSHIAHMFQFRIIQFHSHKVISKLFCFTLLRSSALALAVTVVNLPYGQSEMSEISETQLETVLRISL